MRKILSSFLFLLLITQANAGAMCVKWPNAVFQPTPNPETHAVAPDYGIYWFKNDNGQEKVMRAYMPPSLVKQFANGKLNTIPKHETAVLERAKWQKQLEAKGFFDPKKPTLIFIHGDQATFMKARKRVDFCYSYLKTDGKMLATLNTGNLWKNWNIGVFYWTAFADDFDGKEHLSDIVKMVTYPEMKIYSSKNNAKMQWSYIGQDNKLHFCYQGKKGCIDLPADAHGDPLPVRMLAYYAYLNAIPQGYNKEIRIAGQSLGTQVAIQLSGLLASNKALPQPNELILLDPYFTPEVHSVEIGNGQHISTAKYNYEVAASTLKRRPDLGFAIYRSTKLSTFPTGTRNEHLEKLSAYLRICPAYLSNANKKQRTIDEHMSCAYMYFHSKAFPAPDNYVNANSTPADIKKLMGTRRYCTIKDFNKGCESVSDKPIRCHVEGLFGHIH